MKNAPYANFKSKFDILSARADMTDVQKEDRLDFKHQETKKAKRATHLQPLHIAPAQVVMDQGDPMVLDAFKDPKISRDQCAQQGLCFYCKKPGHNKLDCNEKKKNDAKFGAPQPGIPRLQIQGTTPRYNSYNSRQPLQTQAYGRFPQAHKQHQQPYADPYSTLQGRRIDHGYIENEVESSTSSPQLTPSSISPSQSITNVHKNYSENM
ncbi:hypothetical protein Ptr902_13370 [Pyrenophora tritici-repentis]|nr:hypothetical protein L13192_06281 [Pyrenophora tritici-repentis]KAI2475218.1 hypothetical protein Ptr902_13370 [Pyrenophora tritici-repentis]